MNTDHLKEWLSTPERRELININKLEKQMGVAMGTLVHWLNGNRNLPEKHVPNLIDKLGRIWDKPD